MAVSATEVDNILVRLIGDATSYQRMIDDAVKSTKSATKEIQQSSKEIQSISGSIGMLAASMSSLIQAIAGTGSTLTAFSQFDKTMTESIAIMDVTDAQIQKMKKSALDLAPAAGLGPEVLGRGFYYLASAGLDAKRAIEALPAIVNFAVAGNFDLSKATTLAADAQAALGLKVKDSVKNLENLIRVTDVLTKGNTLSNTTTEQLSLALSTGAAAAGKIFGKSVEEVTAVLAVYADQGIKAQVAGNALSRVFRLLAYSGVTHAAQLRKLNIEIFDQTGKMRPIADIVENLEKVLGNYSDASRGAALETIGFEARVQQAILPLLGASSKIREFEKALKDAGGTTERVAEITRAGFNFQMRALAANIKVAAVEIGAFFAPAIAAVAMVINLSITLWRSFSDEVRYSTIAMGSFLLTMAGLGPLRTILAALGSVGIAAISPLIVMFATLASVIINPFRLLFVWFNPTFVAFRYLITIISAVIVSIQELGGIGEAFSKLEEIAINIVEWLKPIGKALSELGTTIVSKALQGIQILGNATLIIFQNLASNINLTWNDIQYGIVSGIKAIEFVIIHLEKIVYGLWIGIKNVFSAIISFTTTTTQTMQVFNNKVSETVTQVDTFTSTFTTGLSKLTPYLESLVRHLIVIGVIIVTVTIAFKLLAPLIPVITALISSMIVVWKILSVVMSVSIAVIGITIAVIKGLIVIIGFVGGVLGIMVTGLSLFIGELAVLIPVLSLWGVKQAILGILMGIDIALMTAWNAVTSITIGQLIIAAAVTVLFGIALASIGPLISLVIGSVVGLGVVLISFLATALSYVIAPVVGLYLGLYELTKAIQSIPTNVGLLKIVGDIFGEWLGIIKLVIRAIQVDMTLAWQIFELGVLLGLEQIKAMWPQIWEAIKTVFSTAGTLIRNIMGDVFDYITERIQLTKDYWAATIIAIGSAIKSVFGTAFDFIKARLGLLSKTKESQEELDAYAKRLAEINRGFDLNVKLHTGNAARDFKNAFSNVTPIDTDKMKELREQTKVLVGDLETAELVKYWEDWAKSIEDAEDPIKKSQKEVEKLNDEWKDNSFRINKSKHSADNLTASISGSAEAMTRLQHYTDLFFLDQNGLANLNQSGVTSGVEALGMNNKYTPDTEWAKAKEAADEINKYFSDMSSSIINFFSDDLPNILQTAVSDLNKKKKIVEDMGLDLIDVIGKVDWDQVLETVTTALFGKKYEAIDLGKEYQAINTGSTYEMTQAPINDFMEGIGAELVDLAKSTDWGQMFSDVNNYVKDAAFQVMVNTKDAGETYNLQDPNTILMELNNLLQGKEVTNSEFKGWTPSQLETLLERIAIATEKEADQPDIADLFANEGLE